MDKKEKIDLKTTKQAVQKQEYNVEEYAQAAESLFSTKPECVRAAFTFAGVQKATEEKAKEIVKKFLEMKV